MGTLAVVFHTPPRAFPDIIKCLETNLIKRSNRMRISTLTLIVATLLLAACQKAETPAEPAAEAVGQPEVAVREAPAEPASRYDIYAPVTLTADLSHLSDNQKQMLVLLIEASDIMDDLFWKQAFGDKEALLSSIEDPKQRRFAEINYGPWDRLDGNRSFVPGFADKPSGANFYPPDMTK